MNRAERRAARRHKGPLMLECETHGRSEWRADVVCENCGARLVGDGAGGAEFSARAICASCARKAGDA